MTWPKLSIVVRVLLFAGVAFLIVYPLAMMLIGSLRTEMPGLPGGWGLKGWVEAYSDPEFLGILWTTVEIAIWKTIFSVLLAITFAWTIHRTNMPGRRFFDVALHVSFFVLPPLPILLGWILLFAPKSGIVNQWFIQLFDAPLFNVFSLAGIVLVSIAFSVPFYYIFLSPAFRLMDISLEEAAKVSGASDFTTLSKVTLPLLMPAILAVTLLSFIRGMESFEAPLFLGGPGGIEVLSTKIFNYIASSPANYMAALATGVTLLGITFVLVVLQWKILGGRQYVTVTGRGYRPRPVSLGRWRWPAFIILFVIFSGLTIPPAIIVLQTSFMKMAGMYSLPGGTWTLQNYYFAFTHPHILKAIKNTAILATVAPTISILICTLVAYVVVKTKFRERKILDLITWIPWAVPGIVMGLALLWAWIFIKPFGFTLYGSLPLLVIVMVFMGFPIGTRIMTSTMVQISSELEESAKVSGASWLQSFIHIWLPLLRNGLFSAWIIKFTATIRVLAPVILLISPQSIVISTTFYDFWSRGKLEAATVVGLIQAAMIVVPYLAFRIINRMAGGRIVEEEAAGGW